MVRHAADAVTASRLLAAPVVVGLLLSDHAHAAFFLFCGAALTDLVDGWLARRLGPTRWGLLLDSAGDKALAGGALLTLWWLGRAPAWLALVLPARDAVVTLGWLWARSRGRTWTPSALAQVGTSFEGTALGILMVPAPWWGVRWPLVGQVLGAEALLLMGGAVLLYLWRGPPPPVTAS
ncbi:MAG: CDP-alcohol phosphatidyltransferase family protein [Alphaproteobacteria bacterium]|nr:CDP-alcohol phosphatidyltransferase family protein [Alphaproteobacteria bacterium]